MSLEGAASEHSSTDPARGGAWQPDLPETLSGHPIEWLTRYDEVRDAFLSPKMVQASYDAAKKTIFDGVLITLDGKPHRDRRRFEFGLVRDAAAEWLEATAAPDSLRRLAATALAQGRGDLVQIARLLGTSVAARIVGLVDCDTPERLSELARLMAILHEGAVVQWSQRPEEDVARDTAAAREEYRATFFEPALARRKAALGGGDEDVSAIDGGLIELLLRGGADHGMDEPQMLRESIHFLIASAQTTATVMVHAFDEIHRWIAEDPSRAARLEDPLLLKNAIYEALRLWPPSGWQFRIPSSDVELRSGRHLSEGTVAGLNIIQANRDPAVVGAEADRFDPERELPSEFPRHGLAFGFGTHLCLGKRLVGGIAGTAEAPGVLVTALAALLAAGCRPDPDNPPVQETATRRHQFRSYSVVFSGGAGGASS